MDTHRRILRSRTLARAADILGGREALRRRLNVSALVLGMWMSGAEVPPTDAFLKAVDIVEQVLIDSLQKKGAGPPNK
jgi:hypothetical protein